MEIQASPTSGPGYREQGPHEGMGQAKKKNKDKTGIFHPTNITTINPQTVIRSFIVIFYTLLAVFCFL